MNSAHDLGGMHGLGPINPEPEVEEPIFHAPWERRAFAMTLTTSMLGRWNIDIMRHSRERQHPIDYLSNSYYENWLAGMKTLLVETGLVTDEEITQGRALTPSTDPDTIKVPDATAAVNQLKAVRLYELESTVIPTFKIGDTVRVKNFHPIGHTRAPRYVRGHLGTIDRIHGVHIFPDTHLGGVTEGYPLYSVKFSATELWGPDGDAKQFVYAELWEPYLDGA